MGIYAPGITKPDHCCNCQFCEDLTDDCLLQNDAHWSTYSEQIKNCPLIEIPEPHGRLIDGDEMCADLATVDPQYETMIEWCIQVTNAQPTVIEGSENHDD